MTVQEMVEDLFGLLGNNTEFWIYDSNDAFDISADGTQKLLTYLNRAYRKIAAWKFDDGTLLRFRDFSNVRKYWKASGFATTVSSQSGATVVLGSEAKALDNKYERWVLKVGTETKVIIGYNGSTKVATLDSEFSAAIVDGTAATMYKRFFKFSTATVDMHDGENVPLSLSDDIMSVQAIDDLTNKSPVVMSSRTDSFVSTTYQQQNVSTYRNIVGGVEFNVAPQDDTVFDVAYMGYPEKLSAADQVPVVPPVFHDAIVLWSSWIGLKLDRDYNRAYMNRVDFERILQSAMQQSEGAWELVDSQVVGVF